MIFWITASLLALTVAGFIAIALLRGRNDGEHPAAYDLRVYQDQLREVDRDLARNVIAPEDADRIRAEVGRRVLAADAQLRAAKSGDHQPQNATLIMAILTGVFVIVGSLGLYTVLGQPGARDMSLASRIAASDAALASRPSQADFEAKMPPRPERTAPDPQHQELMVKLRATVAQRPNDLEGLQHLARNEASIGNLKAAYTAQQKVIALKHDAARPEDYMFLADLLISAANGYVSPEAQRALDATLQQQPRNAVARYYYGLMMIQNDRPDIAFSLWDRLLREGPHDTPWAQSIRANIRELAWRAGQAKYEPPAPPAPATGTGQSTGSLSGPTAEDMANAAGLSPAERQDMIRGMVGQLSERLATEGGSPEEWARLIGALGVLGETDRAGAIWGEAQQVFAQTPEALALLRAAATRAGLVE
ncbi:MAG: c-type cytochrome biogenesis protein CcmI [Rhodobacterales bacterium]|nr:MAG: c-type cytochrome biogenesis protein CcmI [Rhodobacterales bacterium]